MSDPDARSNTKTWVVLITLLGLGAVMAYLFVGAGSGTSDDGWTEPDEEFGRSSQHTRDTQRAEIGPSGREPAPPAPAVEEPLGDFDPQRLAELLVDGGGQPLDPATLGPREPPILPGPEAEPNEPEPEVESPLPERLGPTSPEQAIRRAVFWRDLLETRIDAMRRQAEDARESGNDGVAARFEARAARLERERPGIGVRLAELEAAAAPPAVEEEPEVPDETGDEVVDEPDEAWPAEDETEPY